MFYPSTPGCHMTLINHVVTATNDAYAEPLAVTLTSVLLNATHPENIKIYTIDGNISNDNKIKLENIVNRFGSTLHFLTVDKSRYQNFAQGPYIPVDAYYRIDIPELLGPDVDTALYLDCDLIVKTDIARFFQTDITAYSLAAVESTFADCRKQELSIPDTHSYFNSGVLLLNLKKWRERNLSRLVLNWIDDNPEKLRFMDQDALNACLYDDWLKLDPSWNYTTGHWERQTPLQSRPNIIHFTGSSKPWNASHPLEDEYHFYREQTNW